MCSNVWLPWNFTMLLGAAYYSMAIKSSKHAFLIIIFEQQVVLGKLLKTASGKSILATFYIHIQLENYEFEGILKEGETRIYTFSCFIKLHAQLPLEFFFVMMLSSFWTAVLTFVKF